MTLIDRFLGRVVYIWAVIQSRYGAFQLPNVRLPFNINMPIRAYLYNAYATGILTASKPMSMYTLRIYLQIFFPHSKLTPQGYSHKFEFYPQFGVWGYNHIGYFKNSIWSRADFLETSQKVLIRKLCNSLSQGNYLELSVNEFFIPGTQSFLRINHLHHFLIIGYEAPSNSFIGISYMHNGTLGECHVPAYLLVTAIRSQEGRRTGYYSPEPQILEIKVLPRPTENISRFKIGTQIFAYLKGECAPRTYFEALFTDDLIANFTSDEVNKRPIGEFGMAVYPVFRRWIIEVVSQKHSVDLRATRTLWEHKLVFCELIECMAKNSSKQLHGASGRYTKIVRLAESLHLICFAFNERRSPDISMRVGAILDEMEVLERTVLTEVGRICLFEKVLEM
jgi:hypothetical protein